MFQARFFIIFHFNSIENRNKLAAELDICDQLLLILQEYDEDSKK
jgi:hypothetical protein